MIIDTVVIIHTACILIVANEVNYFIVYYIVVLCLKRNMTPVEEAVVTGNSATVHYFVKTLGMDITKIAEVVLTHNFIIVYMFSVY